MFIELVDELGKDLADYFGSQLEQEELDNNFKEVMETVTDIPSTAIYSLRTLIWYVYASIIDHEIELRNAEYEASGQKAYDARVDAAMKGE